jgi:hypothetical protein
MKEELSYKSVNKKISREFSDARILSCIFPNNGMAKANNIKDVRKYFIE